MKIIGNGMIARAFAKCTFPNAIIFASGVSNSACTVDSEYEREVSLLHREIENSSNKKFIYFSSTSIYDSSDSMYKIHKRNCEALVMRLSADYLIFRLPQVVGEVSNNTLVPYFVKSLLAGSSVNLASNAYRNLLDIDDLCNFFQICLTACKHNEVFNVIPGDPWLVSDIYCYIAELLNAKPYFKITNSPKDFSNVNSCHSSPFFQKFIIPNGYTKRVLEKWIPTIAEICSKEGLHKQTN